MKKTLTAIALLAGTAVGYSQGNVYFYMYNTENGSTLKQAIYGAQAGNTVVTYGNYTVSEQQGSSALTHETPAGTTAYTAAPIVGQTPQYYVAQMLAAPGSGDALSSLVPVGTTLPFFTTASASGFTKGFETVAIGGTSPTATVAVAAWYEGSSGQYTTLAEAQAAGEPWGISDLANDTLATGINTPTGMPQGITSFSLGVATPEPSTIALGVMGASALLFRRRK
jgi:hypothetical protein